MLNAGFQAKLFVLAVEGIPKDVAKYIPGMQVGPEQPASSTNNKYFEWLEGHTQIVYPALAIFVLGLMAFAILSSWKKEGMDGETKMRLKKAIVQELRLQMGGMAAEALARTIGLSGLKTAKLLEEMQRDGILWSSLGNNRLTMWRLKGLGSEPVGKRRNTA
ncbi:MAG: hypothetical protein ACJ790_06775 [Myxococcaceae bacterium]